MYLRVNEQAVEFSRFCCVVLFGEPMRLIQVYLRSLHGRWDAHSEYFCILGVLLQALCAPRHSNANSIAKVNADFPATTDFTGQVAAAEHDIALAAR